MTWIALATLLAALSPTPGSGTPPGALAERPSARRPPADRVQGPARGDRDEFLLDLGLSPGARGLRVGSTSDWGYTENIPVVRVNLGDPGTGWPESFLYHAPVQAHLDPRPLVVAFHSFARSEVEILLETSLVQEAYERGWYLVAPLSANKRHYSSLEGQVNTEFVIQWMLTHFNIDTTRLYGVGFSMGGGMVTSYAARHLDPTDHMFAAIVDHTGSISLVNTYADEPASRFFLDFWYGQPSGTTATTWNLRRSSILDFDPMTQAVDGASDMARNLLHLGLRSTRASNDPLTYLTVQADVLDGHMIALGAAVGVSYDYRVVPFGQHVWQLLNFSTTMNWLSQFTLQLPTSADTLADGDRRFFHFDVVQDAPGAFTPFSWTVDTAQNRVGLTATTNLLRVTVDTGAAGLDPLQTLTVDVGTDDGLADEVRLRGYPVAPGAVELDALPSASWSHDGVAGHVVLTPPDGAPHTWTILP